MITARALRVVVGLTLILLPNGCTDAPQSAAIGNNGDTMDHNMAAKADRLEAMAAESSATMANDMMRDIDTNAAMADDNSAMIGNSGIAANAAAAR